MRIVINRASDELFQEIRENQTEKDIINLINEFKSKIVVRKGGCYYILDNKEKCGYRLDRQIDYTIIIYDSYLE